MRFTMPLASLLAVVEAFPKILPRSQTAVPAVLEVSVDENGTSVPGVSFRLWAGNRQLVFRSSAARVEEPGTAMVEIKNIEKGAKALKSVKADVVEIADDGKRFSIRAGKANQSSASWGGDRPPALPCSVDGAPVRVLPAARELLDLAKKLLLFEGCEKYGSFEESLIEVVGGAMTTVATDSVRLGIYRIEIAPIADATVIAPLTWLKNLKAILDKDAHGIELILQPRIIEEKKNRTDRGNEVTEFTTINPGALALLWSDDNGRWEYMIEHSVKPFPNYRQILPRSWDMRATLDKEELKTALAVVKDVASDYKSKMIVDFRDGESNVRAGLEECGNVSSYLVPSKVESKGETALSMAMNRAFIEDFVSVTNGAPEVVVEMKSSVHPMVWKCEEHPEFTYVCMPINL